MTENVLLALLPLATYAFVMSITPGPNNFLLASSSLNFGFRKTIPHWVGINIGFTLLLMLCSFGIGSLVINVPTARTILNTFGTGYLLFLAWQMRKNLFQIDDNIESRPMSTLSATLFQFANPKAWIMSATAAATFFPNIEPFALAVGAFIGVFLGVGICCGAVWVFLGSSLKLLLKNPFWSQASSYLMVFLILSTAAGIWI
jgi:threonine/homoserine/homoserine lactone efflux protein